MDRRSSDQNFTPRDPHAPYDPPTRGRLTPPSRGFAWAATTWRRPATPGSCLMVPFEGDDVMRGLRGLRIGLAATALALASGGAFASEEGFIPLFDGKDLAEWKVPEGDNGHWKILDGVIDYD